MNSNVAQATRSSGIADAERVTLEKFVELGHLYSTGTGGADLDLVQAHKWFNLAAMKGDPDAPTWRAAIAAELSRAEIAVAQREARDWLSRH